MPIDSIITPQLRARESTGPVIPLVRNVICWQNNTDTLERPFELRDIQEGFIATAITEGLKAKACHMPQIRSSEFDIADPDLIDPNLNTSNKLTRDKCDNLATILQND